MTPSYEDPWLPTWWDIVALQNGKAGNTDTDYWLRFGPAQISIPSDCPTVSEHWDRVLELFDELYASRRINSETMEQWQIRLQRTLDRVAPRYEEMYALYAGIESLNLQPGEHRTGTDVLARTGADTDTNTLGSKVTHTRDLDGWTRTKYADTPDTAFNQDDTDYASSLSRTGYEDNGTVTDAGSGSDTVKKEKGTTDTRTLNLHTFEGGRDYISSLNSVGDAYRYLDWNLANEFQNCFLNILWS